MVYLGLTCQMRGRRSSRGKEGGGHYHTDGGRVERNPLHREGVWRVEPAGKWGEIDELCPHSVTVTLGLGEHLYLKQCPCSK